MNYDKFPKINISGYENEACTGKTICGSSIGATPTKERI